MRPPFRLLYVLLIPVLTGACGRYPCHPAEIRYQLVGFSDAEADTIIYRRYDRQSSQLIDTIRFDALNPITFIRYGDTLHMIIFRSDAFLAAAYDYEMYFPGAGQTVRVHDITEPQRFGSNKGPLNPREPGCVNEITSYAIDGQLMHTVIFPNTIRIAR